MLPADIRLKTSLYAWVCWACAFAYAVVRYHVFGNVRLDEAPILIFNKSIAFAIILWLMLAQWRHAHQAVFDLEYLFKLAKIYTVVHVLLSLVVLSPNYFPKLSTSGVLTLEANLALLFGVLAAAHVWVEKVKIAPQVWYLLLALHLFFLGFRNWVKFEQWNAHLPPITLLCWLIVLGIMLVFWRRKNK
jgi:hypothetical protein